MKKRVLVGLSGGVDSAVAAYLLMKEGYEVVAGFMKNYISEDENCPTREDRDEAIKVAEFLGIKEFIIFDFREEYNKKIVDYIYDGYKKGITPNPDILCNSEIKFKLFLEKALKLNFDYIATGHYARIITNDELLITNGANHNNLSSGVEGVECSGTNEVEGSIENNKIPDKNKEDLIGIDFSPAMAGSKGQKEKEFQNSPPLEGGVKGGISENEKQKSKTIFRLLKGVDPNKDQSYFLSGLNQFQLSKSLFPIGALEKSEVRKIAKEIGLPNALRKDSQGICFIGKVSMSKFLQKKIPTKSGNIVNTKGEILGKHKGAYFYTIGQRKGIELGGGPALFVVKKDVIKNEITVGTEQELTLFSDSLTASSWHWIGEKLDFPISGKVKIRYRQEDQDVEISDLGNGRIKALFKEKQRAITSGQIIALYIDDELVGSGIIE